MVILHRIVPENHLFRWYSVHVQSTLLDPWSVVCAWGSLITNYRKERIIHCENQDEAKRMALQIITRKQKRGYKIAYAKQNP